MFLLEKFFTPVFAIYTGGLFKKVDEQDVIDDLTG